MQNFNLGQICPKKVFSVQNIQSKHHRIHHIQISLGTEFHLEQTTMVFFDQIYPKHDIFGAEQKKLRIH